MCGLSKRCHVLAEGHQSFGTKFSAELVRRLASSSVQIVSRSGGSRTLLASGTLIAPNVVLCAQHSLQLQSSRDLAIVMFYECDAKTAPKGEFPSEADKAEAWRTCTLMARKRQGVCTQFLEQGEVDGFDYALLAVKWITATARYGEGPRPLLLVAEPSDVDAAERAEDLRDSLHGIGSDSLPCNVPGLSLTQPMPRTLTLPRPGAELTGELLLIGHPYSRAKQEAHQCQPTQASVAKLIDKGLKNPGANDDKHRAYAAARFDTYVGASGGGVFNERGELVGVLKGDWGNSAAVPRELMGSAAFLHLSPAALVLADRANAGKAATVNDQGLRLRQWMGGGSPLLKGDPTVDVDFQVVRRKKA